MTNDWHSAAVICDFVDGELCFLVQDSRSRDPRWADREAQTKCVGGGSKYEDHDDPVATMLREVKEEIFLSLRPGVKPQLIHRKVKGNHGQYFYLIWFNDLLGKMRRRNTILIDGDSILFNLRFIKASEIDVVFESHREALRKASSIINNIPLQLVG